MVIAIVNNGGGFAWFDWVVHGFVMVVGDLV